MKLKPRRKHAAWLIVAGVAFMLFLVSCPRKAPGTFSRSIDVGGVTRSFLLHIPDHQETKGPFPLVIALHPFTGSGRSMERLTGFSSLADREGFIVAYPDGRQRVWNANPSQPSSIVGDPADDVAFIEALIDHLADTQSADPNRVYVTGASSGGLMANRIAGELTGKLAAAASVMITLPITWPDDVEPSAPLPFLLMHGDADPFFPWEGGVVEEGPSRQSEYLSAADSVGFWVANNLAEEEAVTDELPDVEPDDGTTAFRSVHAAGADGAEVRFYGIENGGHTWPGSDDLFPEFLVGKTCLDFDASEVIWDFFQRHARE